MKKFAAVCIIGLVLGTTGVFAQHPDGWGIGVVGQGGGGLGGLNGFGPALSLKAPVVPVYWGLNFSIRNRWFGFGVTGDYYIFDRALVPDIGLGWYFGVGGYLGFGAYNDPYDWYDYSYLNFGVRVPIGLSWVLPLSLPVKLELFLDIFPSLGLGLGFWDSEYDNYDHDKNHVNFDFNFGGELGLRVWF